MINSEVLTKETTHEQEAPKDDEVLSEEEVPAVSKGARFEKTFPEEMNRMRGTAAENTVAWTSAETKIGSLGERTRGKCGKMTTEKHEEMTMTGMHERMTMTEMGEEMTTGERKREEMTTEEKMMSAEKTIERRETGKKGRGREEEKRKRERRRKQEKKEEGEEGEGRRKRRSRKEEGRMKESDTL